MPIEPPNADNEGVSSSSIVRLTDQAKLVVVNDRWEPSSNEMCAVGIEPLCSIGEMAVFNNVDLCLFSLMCWIVVGDRVAGEVVV